jgi:hypothetical protein
VMASTRRHSASIWVKGESQAIVAAARLNGRL